MSDGLIVLLLCVSAGVSVALLVWWIGDLVEQRG